jgi:3-methyladenine DNA glycosylase/8-oxoguanine DNA glycosylase
MSSIHQQSFKYHHFITPIHTLRITHRKRRSLTLTQLRRAYMVDIASRADLEQPSRNLR